MMIMVYWMPRLIRSRSSESFHLKNNNNSNLRSSSPCNYRLYQRKYLLDIYEIGSTIITKNNTKYIFILD